MTIEVLCQGMFLAMRHPTGMIWIPQGLLPADNMTIIYK